MTTEQAIKLLHRLQDEQFDGIHGDERREALSMAVRALESNLVKESGDLVQDLVKDCISRQMAIDAHCELCGDRDKCNCDICPDVEVFQLLPSAQPERMRGKWERHYCEDGNPDGWRCDNCDEWYYFGQTLPNFCPNCGARMEGEANERYDLQTGCD